MKNISASWFWSGSRSQSYNDNQSCRRTFLEGRYGAEPFALPVTSGFGAWGVVDAIGETVNRLAIGDAILPIGGGLWSHRVIVDEWMAPEAPIDLDPEQAGNYANKPEYNLLNADIHSFSRAG